MSYKKLQLSCSEASFDVMQCYQLNGRECMMLMLSDLVFNQNTWHLENARTESDHLNDHRLATLESPQVHSTSLKGMHLEWSLLWFTIVQTPAIYKVDFQPHLPISFCVWEYNHNLFLGNLIVGLDSNGGIYCTMSKKIGIQYVGLQSLIRF